MTKYNLVSGEFKKMIGSFHQINKRLFESVDKIYCEYTRALIEMK